ncbi:MAG: hypothetical protein KC910_23935 [Candidatus Eremiobacteraeota bacterium]|nr:hypothetical protein [Candidatus Eremiobacteraeota bacterium]
MGRLEAYLTEGKPVPEFDQSNPAYDLFLLGCDPNRAMLESPKVEALGPDKKVYIQILQQLEKISRGAFRPRQIVEVWKGAQGPVEIRYQQDGQTFIVQAHDRNNRIDPSLLLQLNLAILASGLQFELSIFVHPEHGEHFLITVLNREERLEIERHRRLPLIIFSLPRLFVPLGNLGPPRQPAEVTTHLGTVNEFLDRSLGRLELDLEEGAVTGLLRYEGLDHEEDLEWLGSYQDDRLEGTIRGRVQTRAGASEDYVGTFEGLLHHGGKTASGTWRGWVAVEGDQPPEDASLINEGEWATIEENCLDHDDPHLRRFKTWLEEVWKARQPQDYSWTLLEAEQRRLEPANG